MQKYLLILIIVLVAGSFAFGQTLSQANAAIKNLQSNYTTLSGKLTTTQGSLKSTTDSLIAANKRVAALQSTVQALQTKIRLDSLYYIARMGTQDQGLQNSINTLAGRRTADSIINVQSWAQQSKVNAAVTGRTDSLSKVFVTDTLQIINGYSNKVAPHFYQISLTPIQPATITMPSFTPILPTNLEQGASAGEFIGTPSYADLPHTTKKLKPIK